MKRLAVVAKNGVAVIVNEKSEIVTQVNAVDSTEALLNAVKELLQTVPVNSADDLGEEVTLYLPRTIRGLASGAVAGYIRNKKTAGGSEMQENTIELYKECMVLFGERSLSVVFKDAEYLAKNSKEVSNLVNSAWIKVKGLASAGNNSNSNSTTQAPAVNPKILSKIKELEDQIVDAILEDDEELEASLNAKLTKLKAMVSTSAPAKETTEVAKEESNQVSEEDMDLEKASQDFNNAMNA